MTNEPGCVAGLLKDISITRRERLVTLSVSQSGWSRPARVVTSRSPPPPPPPRPGNSRATLLRRPSVGRGRRNQEGRWIGLSCGSQHWRRGEDPVSTSTRDSPSQKPLNHLLQVVECPWQCQAPSPGIKSVQPNYLAWLGLDCPHGGSLWTRTTPTSRAYRTSLPT